ncbi:Senecionine N-oxygenase, partial [Oleoguttula sp. CCFEE 5521]
MAPITVGVLALQGAFAEHVPILKGASLEHDKHGWTFCLVRTPSELASCDALIIPGGESTAISLIASRTELLEPLRDFINGARKPVWGTCAGLILLADVVSGGGPKLEGFGGLAVEVRRNYFGRQVESFEADLDLPLLASGTETAEPFHTIFIRAPVVSSLLSSSPDTSSTAPDRPAVEILARLPAKAKAVTGPGAGKSAGELGEEGDIVAVRQGNVFGTAFHPELTGDGRIHGWWLGEVGRWVEGRERGGEAEAVTLEKEASSEVAAA